MAVYFVAVSHFLHHASSLVGQIPKLDVAGSIPVSRSIPTVPSIRKHPITSEQLKFQVCDLWQRQPLKRFLNRPL
jgi:hypothetical protein